MKQDTSFWTSIKQSIWPGLGLFGESYLLFSVGTLHPIWELLYSDCFDGDTCPKAITQSLTYSVVIGVIIGMIVIGLAANHIGRRNGSILTASLMSFGSIGMTFSSLLFPHKPGILFTLMSVFLFLFGVGVGGEYPLSASSASEKSMESLKLQQQNQQRLQGNMPTETAHQTQEPTACNKTLGRGKNVIMVFAMQGWGIVINSLTLTFLLLVTGQFGSQIVQDDYYYYDHGAGGQRLLNAMGNYNERSLLTIWQIIYAIGAIVLLYVLASRIIHLSESSVWAEDKEKRLEMEERSTYCGELKNPASLVNMGTIKHSGGEDMKDKDVSTDNPYIAHDAYSEISLHGVPSKTSLLFKFYGTRLFGTSTVWLAWDVAFYGNKLFQSSFLFALIGEDTTLLRVSAAATLNALVALAGYYAAAFVIDKTSVGRLRLQLYGFLVTGTLFCLCGVFQESMTSTWLVVLYLGSSFFGQCGPNCTTFLIPAEVFPTEIRTLCHGCSAAAGKVGALIAAVLFNFINEKDLFYVSGYCSYIACLITFMTIPETTTLDLNEQDVRWRMILDGKQDQYRGSATDIKHLSFLEKRWSE